MTKKIRIAPAVGTGKTDRKPYAAPQLVEFGPVGQLTQAGTGLKTENMAGMGPASKRA